MSLPPRRSVAPLLDKALPEAKAGDSPGDSPGGDTHEHWDLGSFLCWAPQELPCCAPQAGAITVRAITFPSLTAVNFQLNGGKGDIQCHDFHGCILQFLPPPVSLLSVPWGHFPPFVPCHSRAGG